MTLIIGQVLQNRYRVEVLLGQGGMGAVYRATDLTFNAVVAVKENLDTSPEAQKQFAREASILYHLHHSNLPRVIDYFSIPGQGQYLVMDFVEGQDLGQILAQGPVPKAHALAWIGQVLDALAYLHGQDPPVIHRDVKPANIKITPAGHAVLVDFGLAKVYDPILRTTIGARAVTPGYAPPEQYGQGHTDARSDLYSVGATLYALLTGQEPPDGVDLMVGNVTLIPPRQLNQAISPRIEGVVLKAMQPRPTNRPQTASEFRAALVGVATPASAQPAASRPKPWGWVVVGTLTLLLALVGFWWLTQTGDGGIPTAIAVAPATAVAPTPPAPTATRETLPDTPVMPTNTSTLTLAPTDTSRPTDEGAAPLSPNPVLPSIDLAVFSDTGQMTNHPMAEVRVPAGYKIISGGARANWTGSGSLLTSSYPASLQRWIATAKDHKRQDPATITVWAIAIRDPDDQWEVKIFEQTSAEANHPSARVSVLDGYTLVGGGAQVHWTGAGNLLTASFPVDLTTWEARSKDHGDASPAKITVYAIGIRARNGAHFSETRLFYHKSPQASHPRGSVILDDGFVLLGGGALVDFEGSGNLLTASYPSDDLSWAAESKDHIWPSPATLTVYAIGSRQISRP